MLALRATSARAAVNCLWMHIHTHIYVHILMSGFSLGYRYKFRHVHRHTHIYIYIYMYIYSRNTCAPMRKSERARERKRGSKVSSLLIVSTDHWSDYRVAHWYKIPVKLSFEHKLTVKLTFENFFPHMQGKILQSLLLATQLLRYQLTMKLTVEKILYKIKRTLYKIFVHGGEIALDAFSCRSLFAKELLITELFWGQWPRKILQPVGLRHSVLISVLSMYSTCKHPETKWGGYD